MKWQRITIKSSAHALHCEWARWLWDYALHTLLQVYWRISCGLGVYTLIKLTGKILLHPFCLLAFGGKEVEGLRGKNTSIFLTHSRMD